MMMVCEFHAQHRRSPGFAHWFERTKPLSDILSLAQLLRLELFGRALNGKPTAQSEPQPEAATEGVGAMGYAPSAADWTGWGPTTAGRPCRRGKDADLPLSVLLDETGDAAASILAGRALNSSKEHYAQ